MGYAKRVDGTHKAIVHALRKVGCQVADTSRLGGGFPDLVIRCGAFRQVTGRPGQVTEWGKYLLMEVKTPRGRLTKDQEKFIASWPETVVVDSVDAALKAVGVR